MCRRAVRSLLPLFTVLLSALALLAPPPTAGAPAPQIEPPAETQEPIDPGPRRQRPRRSVPVEPGPAPEAAPTAPPTPVETPLARGRVTEKIVSLGDPARSYALYLPSGYDPARRWPVVYVLDARGRARQAMERFMAGAERFGYVLASSYDSASDQSRDPNIAAVNAMWTDTHARLAIDDRRVYLAGFSGTVRSACAIATSVAGKVTGVIGAAAGWSAEAPPTRRTPFVFFGTAGNRDYNFDELLELEETLTRLGVPHRIELFAGDHAWMPEPLATDALAWMEVQAMRAGVREREPAALAALWERDLAEARALEAAGRQLDAWRRFDGAARDFEGLLDVAPARREAERLGATRKVQEDRRKRAERRARDRQTLRDAYATLAAMQRADVAEARRLARTLPVAILRKRLEREGESDEGDSAYRLLSSLFSQTSFYLVREAIERREPVRAALFLSVATEIHPKLPGVWVQLAAARALSGDRGGSLTALKRAAELGYDKLPALADDPDFAALRDDPDFRAIVGPPRQPAAAGNPGGRR